MHKRNKPVTLYSFSLVIILALLMLFSMITFSSYNLSRAFAQNSPSVLSDDDDRDDDSSENESDDEDEDELDDEDEIDDEDELEDEDEPDDEDEVDDELYENLEEEFKEYLEGQKDLQEESIEQLKKLSERSGVVGFLIGPDTESIKKLQEIVDANTRMLQQLQELKQQSLTTDEQQALDSLANSIETQNETINNEIDQQENSFSLFGWLLRLFDRD